jgi:alpha-amylase
MMKVLRSLIFIFLTLTAHSAFSQDRKKVLLQGFWWDFKNNNYPQGWGNYLVDLAPRLREMGIDAVWVPVNQKNSNPNSVGYIPFDHYDLGDKFQKNHLKTPFGDKDEYLRMVGILHANGIDVIQDVVLNHCGDAGSASGQGGRDPANGSIGTAGGFKNFRYSSFSTPGLNESQNDYWTRIGRWHKNYQNFNNCTANCNDINGTFWGPDINYNANAIGRSSNIPTTGEVEISGTTRPYHNPAQTNDFMRNEARRWMVWLKKQTGIDGFRLDAIKHFPVEMQEDFIYNVQNEAGFANGTDQMFTVGEWVGSKPELDAYVRNMQRRAGTFDFGLRGFSDTPGLNAMVYGLGNYNMSNLPGTQQDERYRTVPFVNNHDTFRPTQPNAGSPSLLPNGNYPAGRWNSSQELAPNIDPREPRHAIAYAIACAVDGSPQIFFEDLFDIGTTGKRFTHFPKNVDSLPVRVDIANIIRCHQKFDFKGAPYRVRTAPVDNPFFLPGSSNADLLIFERAGRAIIAVNDNFTAAQSAWINTDFEVGTVLKDYSGNFPDVTVSTRLGGPATGPGRVLIQAPSCNGAFNTTTNKGYAIYAPASMNTMFNAPFAPTQRETQIEWEMANDLGDNHFRSLRQGGALPARSRAIRNAGKIYAEAGKTITYRLFPSFTTQPITLMLGNQCGRALDSITGAGNLTKTFTPNSTGWFHLRVRNATDTSREQRVWVNVSYTSPQDINALESPSYQLPIVNLGANREICVGQTITLSALIGSPYTYRWTRLDGTQINTSVGMAVNTSGTFVAIATNPATGCEGRDTIVVTTKPSPIVPITELRGDTVYVVNPQAGITYSWFVNNQLVNGATATNLLRPANASNIIARATNAGGCFVSSVNALFVKEKVWLSNEAVSVYPNPMKDALQIRILDEKVQKLSAKIFNIQGIELMSTSTIGTSETILNVQELPKGLYIIKLQSGNQERIERLVKD